MIADAILVKYDADGIIDDVIVIENKISDGTRFTKRQKAGWKEIDQNGKLKVKAVKKSVLDDQLKFENSQKQD